MKRKKKRGKIIQETERQRNTKRDIRERVRRDLERQR
jgi:hypothetical protein